MTNAAPRYRYSLRQMLVVDGDGGTLRATQWRMRLDLDAPSSETVAVVSVPVLHHGPAARPGEAHSEWSSHGTRARQVPVGISLKDNRQLLAARYRVERWGARGSLQLKSMGSSNSGQCKALQSCSPDPTRVVALHPKVQGGDVECRYTYICTCRYRAGERVSVLPGLL